MEELEGSDELQGRKCTDCASQQVCLEILMAGDQLMKLVTFEVKPREKGRIEIAAPRCYLHSLGHFRAVFSPRFKIRAQVRRPENTDRSYRFE